MSDLSIPEISQRSLSPIFTSVWIPVLWVIVALIPIFLVRDFLPANELRYISIADEAMAEGEVFAFTNQGVAYADKPPLYLWIVIAARWIAGPDCLWIISLFSLVPAIIIALVMNRWTDSILPRTYRAMATLMLLTCGLFTGMMVTLRMDMLMTMWIVLALYEFFKMSEGKGTSKSKWLFPIYVFLAVFTKGPMGLLIPLIGTAVYLFTAGRLKEWFRYWNLLTWGVLFVICALWFTGVYFDGGKEYLDNLLFHQTMDRAVNSFHHKRPFHYYLVSMWYTFMPWAFLVLGSVIVACVRRSLIRSSEEKLFLSVGVSTLVLLSFISGKLQVYLLPAYPFFVYFAAVMISRYTGSRWLKAAVAIPAAVLSTAIVLLLLLRDSSKVASWISSDFYIVAAIVSLSGIASLVLLWRKGGDLRVSIMTLAYGLLIAVMVGSFAVPALNPYMGYGAVCEKVKPLIDQNPRREVYTWRVRRAENMDVYLGRDVTVLDPVNRGENADRLAKLPDESIVIIPKRYLSDPDVRISGLHPLMPVGNHMILISKK